MFRRIIAGAALCAGAALLGPSPALAQQGACQITGTAAFAQPLGTASKPFEYSFGGTLTNCRGTDTTFPASAAITSNQPIVEGGLTYRPAYRDAGTGSCGSSTTTGAAVISWADGTTTVVEYATTGVTAAINLQGKVVPSATYTAQTTDAQGNPVTVTKTFTTNRLAGGTAIGQLAFQANPAECATNSVRAAGIHGLVGINA